jgi:hypothetical protein
MDRIDALRANETKKVVTDGAVFTYLNWGGAVEPRSFGEQRNVGDHVAHYGLETRLVQMQMMTNYLPDSMVLPKQHQQQISLQVNLNASLPL